MRRVQELQARRERATSSSAPASVGAVHRLPLGARPLGRVRGRSCRLRARRPRMPRRPTCRSGSTTNSGRSSSPGDVVASGLQDRRAARPARRPHRGVDGRRPSQALGDTAAAAGACARGRPAGRRDGPRLRGGRRAARRPGPGLRRDVHRRGRGRVRGWHWKAATPSGPPRPTGSGRCPRLTSRRAAPVVPTRRLERQLALDVGGASGSIMTAASDRGQRRPAPASTQNAIW